MSQSFSFPHKAARWSNKTTTYLLVMGIQCGQPFPLIPGHPTPGAVGAGSLLGNLKLICKGQASRKHNNNEDPCSPIIAAPFLSETAVRDFKSMAALREKDGAMSKPRHRMLPATISRAQIARPKSY